MSLKPMLLLGLGSDWLPRQSSGEQEEEEFNPLDTRHLFDANTVWLGTEARTTSA